MLLLKCCTFKRYIGQAHESLVFDLISASCSLNIHGHEPRMARDFNVGMRYHLHPKFVCGAVKALVRLSACAAASKRWRRIDKTICVNNLMQGLVLKRIPPREDS